MKRLAYLKQLSVAAAVATLSASAVVVSTPAQAQIPVTDVASIAQQLIGYIEQVLQYETELNSYIQQIQQYENQVQNTLDLPAAFWSNINSTLNGVNSVVSKGASIANQAGNLDATFSKTFPNYSTMLSSGNITTGSFQSSYTSWSNNTSAGLNSSLGVANQLLTNLSTDQSRLTSLQGQAQGAGGNLQAIKAAAAVATEGLVQMEQLKTLLAQNVAAQNQYTAQRVAQDAVQQAATQQALAGTTPNFGSGKSY